MGDEDLSDCLSENEVLSILRETMGEASRVRARLHLDACDACQDLLAGLVQRSSGEPAPPSRTVGGPLAPGDVVGRYEIREELGAGAMGIVYLAEDRDLDRRAAVKVLRSQTSDTSARLLREAQALARIAHPNVIVVYEVGTFDERVFMAMEYVDGASLTRWLDGTPRALDEVVDAFVQAGSGLAIAHAAGLVHRDFKPDNVLVGRDGRIRVVDFGLARKDALVTVSDRRTTADRAGAGLTVLTQTNTFVGTPAYMAPELFDGAPADARSDQFAFCVALFEALFGARPFAADSIDALARTVKAGEVRAARSTRVPRSIERAVLRGLRVRPEDRFPSMNALLAEISARPHARSRRVLAGTVVALGVGAALLYPRLASPPAGATTTAARSPARSASSSPTALPSEVTAGTPPAVTAPAPTAAEAASAAAAAASSAPASTATAPRPTDGSPARPPGTRAPKIRARTAESAPPPTASGPLMPTTP